MTPRERGFLLLTSHLGDPERKVLSVAQLRTLSRRMQTMDRPDTDRELIPKDLMAIGYDRDFSLHILRLLQDEPQLDWYLKKGKKRDCLPLTRVSPKYPNRLRSLLGTDCPGCLWYKGDLSVLRWQGVALVGSRELNHANLAFAEEVGKQAALQGFSLISGNARGADRAAQESCLAWGGKVISIVADSLENQPLQQNILYLSEDGFDLPFSAQRALSRNRIIHCLGEKVFVAQSRLYKGGTWNGTEQNLRKNRTAVYCFNDGSPAAEALVQMGAVAIQTDALTNIDALPALNMNFIDQ